MMTFDENYGELPASTLRLYKRAGVTPAEHDMMVEVGTMSFTEIEAYVKSHMVNGSFRMPYPF